MSHNIRNRFLFQAKNGKEFLLLYKISHFDFLPNDTEKNSVTDYSFYEEQQQCDIYNKYVSIEVLII